MEYKNLWDKYKNYVLSELNLNSIFTENHSAKDSELISNLYSGEYYIKSRETVINSNSSSIYNNIVYPKTGSNLPCFGMDLMAFMEKKVIIVFDFQHPTENYSFDHELVKSQIGEYLDNTKDIRFFEPGNHFSRYIYVRKCTIHEINDYFEDFKKYVDVYKSLVNTAKPTEEDTSVYIDFDTYMHKLDPVSGFMESKFGKEFAKNYVNDFLFPYSKEI
jgi:hypothetical protein